MANCSASFQEGSVEQYVNIYKIGRQATDLVAIARASEVGFKSFKLRNFTQY